MRFRPPKLYWYHVTRGLGAAAFAYGLLIDSTDDRTAIIVAAAGLMGLDKVARTETAEKKENNDK